MKRFNRKYRYINEAVPYSDVKKYLQVDRSKEVQQRLDTIFNKLAKLKDVTTSKRGDRVYIPFQVGKRTTKSDTQLEIEALLINNDMELLDYSKGIALDNHNRKTKIGKLLRRLDKSLLQPFANDTSRISNKIINTYIVFSKHKYDIAGMSTNRVWGSCANILTGTNKKYVEMDIKHGTFIAYLVSSNDMNIENPLARINLKPFINQLNENDIIYISDTVYGSGNIPDNFQNQIDDILGKIQKYSIGNFSVSKDVYCDIRSTDVYRFPKKIVSNADVDSIMRILGIEDYKINSDLSVDTNQSVDISEKSLDEIPIKFNVINGYFDCSFNALKTLKNAPNIITEDFDCSENKLKSLDNSPTIVEGDYICSYNQLQSLKGAPNVIEGNFDCSHNKLTNLMGAPNEISGDFDCSENKIESLSGSPTIVEGDYICMFNAVKIRKMSVSSYCEVGGTIEV